MLCLVWTENQFLFKSSKSYFKLQQYLYVQFYYILFNNKVFSCYHFIATVFCCFVLDNAEATSKHIFLCILSFRLENLAHNYPDIFQKMLIAQAQEMARRCVEPPLKRKPRWDCPQYHKIRDIKIAFSIFIFCL